MSETDQWWWVAFGYGVTYVALGGYLMSLRVRRNRVRARLEQRR